MPKRIAFSQCCGVVIDVQDFFLAQLDARLRSSIEINIANLIRLLGYFRIPVLATLERPLDVKGQLPELLGECFGDLANGLGTSFEKDFFDLTKEPKIRSHLGKLKKKQMIVAGCDCLSINSRISRNCCGVRRVAPSSSRLAWG